MDDVKLKEGATRQVYTLTPRKPHYKDTDIHQPQNIGWFIKQAELIQPMSWAGVMSATGANLPGISQDDARKRIASMLREQKLVLLKEPQETPAGNDPNTPEKNVSKPGLRAHGQRSGGGAATSPAPSNLGSARNDQPVTPPASSSAQPVTTSEPATVNDSHQGTQTVEHTETRGCPISMVTGEELLQLTDATLPGPMPLSWQRTFRSNNRKDIGLGAGWTHSLSESLTAEGQYLHYCDSEGRTIRFLCPVLHQKSHYIPEGLIIEARTDGFLLKQYGQYHKLFTRVGRSTHYRLTELHHEAYRENQGFKLQLHHDASNALTRIDGNWGKSLVLERDDLGHIRQVQLHNTRTHQHKIVAEYDYNKQRELIAQRNAAGAGEHYQFENSQLIKRTLSTGFSYYYAWDEQNRCSRTWGDNGIYDYHFTWNPSDKHSIATDSRGYTTHFYYNDYGQIIHKIDPEGAEHRYRYDNGSLSTYTNPEGAEHAYFYDEQKRPLGERDALSNRHSLSYFQGKCNLVTDKSGGIWQYRYNRQGLVECVIDPAGRTTDYQYTPEGLLKETKNLTGTTRYQWNAQAELITLTLPNGLQRHFKHNDWGQITSAETRFTNQSKDQSSTTHFEYTDTGLISEVIPPDGKRISYTYNQNDQLIRHSDPNGRITGFKYDGLDQVISRKDSEGHALSYEYDTERNLKTLINENGERYQFDYDGNERLIKETGFDGRVQHYKYSPAGHLIKHLDSGEVITTFERDALGQMTRKASQKIGDNSQTDSNRYLYDTAGRLTETYNEHQYLTFKYSKLGQLLSETHWDLNEKRQRILSSQQTLHYDYHATDALKSLQLPNGEQIQYHLNEQHQLQQVNWNNQTVTQIERDALGRERIRHQGNLSTYTDYDPMGRLQQQRAINQDNKQNHPIHRQYHYDAYGNLSALKDGPTETRYAYDLINRLEKVETQTDNQTQRETFTFDPAGNLLRQGEKQQNPQQASSKQNSGNRLAFHGDRKFTYDARGNLIQENRGKAGKLQTRFEYNLQNQLTTVHKSAQTTHYSYDPLGRRIQKQDTFGTTRYLWAGDQMVQESRNNIQKTYVFEPGSFKPLAQIQDGQIYHYHLDHLGTPQELTNEEGKIVWKARYKTYGNLAIKEVDDIENNLRFQGQYFDEETGLHYNRHRYYNPNTGQFTTQDPIGLLGGVNNYQYAPNPVGWVDPLGLSCKENAWNTFQKNTAGHFPNSSAAAASHKRMKEVRALDNAERPDATDYLPQSYIDAHEAKFAGGASYFAPKWALDEYGRDNVGRADGQFVMTKSQMDDILVRSGGDMALIEVELGIPAGDWHKNEMVVIEIADPKKYNVRTPTGREEGANDLWLPGGKLPTGHDEAVTDAIPKGAYKEMSIAEATKNAKKKT